MIIKAQAPPKGITEQCEVIPPGEHLAYEAIPYFPENIPTGLGGTNLHLIEFLHIPKHKLNIFSNLYFTITNK